VPKIGPFKALDFKIPTQKTEDLYIASVNHTLDNYKTLLAETKNNKLTLPNTDFDTGKMTHAGEYVLTDKSYARLLNQLAEHDFNQISPELRLNILTFYGDPAAPIDTKKKAQSWQKTQQEVEKLRALPPRETSAVEIEPIP
jgi:hypothetical protein